MKKIIYSIFAVSILMSAASCNKFLDTMPDNRTELDSAEKIGKFLTAAYGERNFYTIAELSSDNMDYFGERLTENKFMEQICRWEDPTESGNADSPHAIWEAYYKIIAVANTALEAIEKLGDTPELEPYKGEALLTRAYHHFLLANIFCLHYDPATAKNNLGIPYIDYVQTTLKPLSERPTLEYTYKRIEEDLTEGMPLIKDHVYEVPKYHFNRTASLAFAARFYQYKADWPKVIQYTTEILGNGASAAQYLRNWREINNVPGGKSADKARMYYDATKSCNYFIRSAYSRLGMYFEGYSETYKYSHGHRAAQDETIRMLKSPWGDYASGFWKYNSSAWTNSVSRISWMKNVRQTQIANPLTGSVYIYSTTVEFWADETLLTRAEAYIMNGDYDEGLADINTWATNIMTNPTAKTIDQVNAYFDAMEYYVPSTVIEKIVNDKPQYTSDTRTIKKELHPAGFTVQAGTQENLIHLLLWARRVETVHQGLRWFDVKRYGLDIHRMHIASPADSYEIVGWHSLLHGDDRLAIQIPQDVIAAGIKPNPRVNILSPRF